VVRGSPFLWLPRRFEGDFMANGEKHLWAEVILQAFSDASGTGGDGTGARTLARHNARVWLLGMSRDFIAVCDMAGVSAGVIRAKARAMALADWSFV
jgi:hypothetical protein